jgi:hypothetical protein
MADSFNPQEFINPKSMLTPGVAGALMMFIVNGVTSAFPEVPPRYLALGLSLLIALIVLSSKEAETAKVYTRCVLWLLNGLIIFVVGFGSANLAAEATSRTRAGSSPSAPMLGWASPAYAQTPAAERPAPEQPAPPSAASQDSEKLKALIERLQRENLILKKEITEERKAVARPEKEVSKEPAQPFFKKW